MEHDRLTAVLAAGVARMAIKQKPLVVSHAKRDIQPVPLGAAFAKLANGIPIASAADLKGMELSLGRMNEVRSAKEFIEVVDELIARLDAFDMRDLKDFDGRDTGLIYQKNNLVKLLKDERYTVQFLIDTGRITPDKTPEEEGEFHTLDGLEAANQFFTAAQTFQTLKARTFEKYSESRDRYEAEQRKSVQEGKTGQVELDREREKYGEDPYSRGVYDRAPEGIISDRVERGAQRASGRGLDQDTLQTQDERNNMDKYNDERAEQDRNAFENRRDVPGDYDEFYDRGILT